MSKLKKFGFLAIGLLTLVAVALYAFAPLASVPGYSIAGYKAIYEKGAKFCFMVLLTLILLLALCVAGFVGIKKGGSKVALFISAGLAILTAVFCFLSKKFYFSANGASARAALVDLGIGALMAGIIAIIDAVILVVVALFDKKN